MKKCIDIYNNNKGRSAFRGSTYIDPLGYEYPNSVVECRDCMFNFGHDSCVLYKEAGLDNKDIKQKVSQVSRERECRYFITTNFSDGGDEYTQARDDVKKISKRLNYPAEYWKRMS